MKRILPYRDYSEHDVVNLFSLDVGTGDTLTDWVENSTTVSIGKWDAGVVVSVKAAELPGDMYNTDSGLSTSGKLREYLGASPTSAHIGYNAYPFNGMTVDAATNDGDVALGITLRETLAFDENGEKMLYYKQKLDEAQAVLPGQTVPVLTRGLLLLSASAFDAYDHDSDGGVGTPEITNISVGAKIYVGPSGTLTTEVSGDSVGSVVATGAGDKVLCKLSF